MNHRPSRSQASTGQKLFYGALLVSWGSSVALLKWKLPIIFLFLLAGLVSGLWLGRKGSWGFRGLLLLSLALPLWKPPPHPAKQPGGIAMVRPVVEAANNDGAVISALVAAEETCLKITPKMNRLSKGLMNLRLPDGETNIFASRITVSDVQGPPARIGTNEDLTVSRTWPVTASMKEVSQVDLWRPLLEEVSWFDHAKVYIVSGEHPKGDLYRYDAQGGFEALAKMKSGEWRSFKGKMNLTWERAKAGAGEPEPEWLISSWRTESMEWIASSKRLFVETLDTALRNREDLAKTRQSQHYQATVKYYREGMKAPPHPYFAPISVNQKEGVSVVDIDGDGFDDIYITVRLGKNMLLHNHGDGTFTEEAAAFGLDLPGHTTCALFADFDNDGDLDVMLGRSLLKSTYLENRGGHFYQHPIPSFMPMAVISMAAADYNGDGLLDVYMCTYRPAAPMGASPAGGVAQVKEGAFDWPDEFFAPELAQEYKRKVAEYTQRKGGTVLDQLGPPNVLLINRGEGRFELAPENNVLGIWRNSLQATWGDFDHDGDPDLFVANDWAPSNLFRNDGAAGFKDISEEAGITSYGFSMGASWGDYDNDGKEDVYVSNMYSAAGRRMTAQIPGLSKMFVESAAGNWLYHQGANGKFTQVAGTELPSMTVMNAGWSWGGCFVDFDNDGFLDLYVLSGYFTAPKELASEIDLESNLWRTMLRTDQNLSRASFRFSPEWKRTPAPDNLGPQIDTRLAGVDRQGDKIWVHSLNGNERNHYFLNHGGRSFLDISGLSGLDNPADSRGFAVLDYDRDGWQDVALVNANEPLFNLYHNEAAKAGRTGGMIAVRFVGGNRTPVPSKEFACRDGFGAELTVDLGDEKLIREHRCGDGWAAQNSATMIVGIGGHRKANNLTVRWPSGKKASAQEVEEGTLVTVYENSADSPTGEAFVRKPYRVAGPPNRAVTTTPIFPVRELDTAAKPARLHVYVSFALSQPTSITDLPILRRLKEELGPEGADIVVVPTDAADDNNKLAVYAKQWKPSSRFLNIPLSKRGEVLAAYDKLLAAGSAQAGTVITDDVGHVLGAQTGVPSLSGIRKFFEANR